LQKKLEDEKKARMDTEKQRLDLQEQLRKMEEELMIGGEIANNAAKQEAALRNANQELIAKKEVEASLHRRMAEQEDEKLVLEEKYSSLNEEVTSKTRKLKKVWSKYQQAKAEIEDLGREFNDEKNELLESVRDLTKQLKLKAFVISKFIPPKVTILEATFLDFFFAAL
jgi:kinesin family protein 3/17